MNPFRIILEKFRVKKTLRFHGQIDALERLLESVETQPLEKDQFYFKRLELLKYELEPFVSLGTMQHSINGVSTGTQKISVTLQIASISQNLQELRFSGKLHNAHYFLFFGFLIGFVGAFCALSMTGEFGGLIVVGILWPIVQLWFNYVWTSQEKALIEEIQLSLQIRIRAEVKL